jgi:hypothetical protein
MEPLTLLATGATIILAGALTRVGELSLDGAIALTFPVKSKIQQCKLLEALSGKGLRNDSLDRKKNRRCLIRV